MKNTIKKIVCGLSAVLLSVALPVTAFAEDGLPDGIAVGKKSTGDVFETSDSLDSVIKSYYGENPLVKVTKTTVQPKNFCAQYVDLDNIDVSAKFVLVFSEDCKPHYITDIPINTVTMKDGTFPPAEQINKTRDYSNSVGFIQLSDIFDENVYQLAISGSDTEAYEKLMNDSNVLSIDIRRIVCESISFAEGIEFNKEVDIDEFIEKYSLLNASKVESMDGYRKDRVHIKLDNSPETFSLLKEIAENDDYSFWISTYESEDVNDVKMQSVVYNIYSRFMTGDINLDGIVDMQDLTDLSLYFLEENTFTNEQKKYADINGDGAVNMADLAHFKQYISGAGVKLGK